MEIDNINKNIQIIANSVMSATPTVPHDKITITYTGLNPTTLEYWLTGSKVGQVNITYNGDSNPTIVEKVSF